MSDDKPFVCTAPGCGQRFTNEDHLAVHRHKHEMTLKLGPVRGDSLVLADQTPTPTRFLKNCDEVGLFHELTGPLEQDFRKEEELRKLPLDLSPLARGPVHTCPEESSTVETLHLSPTPHPESTTGSEQKGLAPLPPALCPASLHIPSVLLASPDTDTATSPSRTTVPVSSSFPLLLQLPSGQTMPVALSASVANVPAGLPLSRPIAMVPGVPGPTSPQPVQSEAKMVSSGEPGDAPSPASPEELVMQSFQQPATSTTETAQGLPSPPVRRTPSSGGRRRRAASEDPDEKRRRFLERNRAAASRCRQKRKVWVQALEKKAEDLDSLNSQLQIEVVKLRTEVVQLKQLLLAHQDCPVTAVLRKTACREDDEEVVSTAGSPLVEAVQHSSISTSDRVGPQGALPAQTPPTHS